MRAFGLCLRTVVLMVLTTRPVVAHTGSVSEGFLGGFAHPIFGLDHVVAMVAVGLWGAFLGPPAIFILPVVFPLVMAFGGVLGIVGVPLPGAEVAIAASAAVLGLSAGVQRPLQPIPLPLQCRLLPLQPMQLFLALRP